MDCSKLSIAATSRGRKRHSFTMLYKETSPLSCSVLASHHVHLRPSSSHMGIDRSNHAFFHLICIIHVFISFHQKTYTGHCQPGQACGGIHANLSLQHHSLMKLTVSSDQIPTSLDYLTEVPWPMERAAQMPRGMPALLQAPVSSAGGSLGKNRLVFRHLS